LTSSSAEVAGDDLAEHLPAPDEGDRAPDLARRRPVASPMPEVAPQTRIALPVRLCSAIASHPGHGESQVGDARRVHHLQGRQRHAAGQAMEVRGPAAEQHRHLVQDHLVKQAGLQGSSDHARPHQADVFPGRRSGLPGMSA
jgi:hypothetical protein